MVATGNLIKATPKGIKRFVLVTSAGVERYNKLPFSILNIFGRQCKFSILSYLSHLYACCIVIMIENRAQASSAAKVS